MVGIALTRGSIPERESKRDIRPSRKTAFAAAKRRVAINVSFFFYLGIRARPRQQHPTRAMCNETFGAFSFQQFYFNFDIV